MSYVFQPEAPVALTVSGIAEKFPVRRVYCVGRNYAANAREMGFDPDREPPFFFCKPADAVVPVGEGGASIPYPPLTKNFHYELELVVAIGQGGRNIPAASAAAHIYGYAVGLDMTRRDLQITMREQGRPWEIGKAFDFSGPVGELTRAAECPSIASANIELTVDGKVRQTATIAHLIWSIDETIANLSTLFELKAGDIIFSGTPEGVGPVTAGQQMVGKIDGLKSISVTVAG